MAYIEHPDDTLLQAYQQEPDADRFIDVSLHLASCADCRQQLQQVQYFRSIYPDLASEAINEQQQTRVDDFITGALGGSEYSLAKDEILSNPAMLKSALYSLSLQPELPLQTESADLSPVSESKQGLWSSLIEWINWPTPAWAGFATAALITLTMTSLVLTNNVAKDAAHTSIHIASYQDNKSMRFIPRQTVPGIGFFSAANNHARPYDNIQLSLNSDQGLQIEWQPVEKANQYELALYRHSDGHRQLVKKVTTTEPHTTLQLGLESLNQRFEWVLSGNTDEQETFITSGGFVISR